MTFVSLLKSRPAKLLLGAAGFAITTLLLKVIEYVKANLDNIELSFGWFIGFYIVAGTVIVLHFTGWLKEHHCEWLVILTAAATFPAIIFL